MLIDDIMPIVVIGGAIAGVLGFTHLSRKKRRRGLTLLSQSQGWAFDPADRRDFGHRYPQFKDFSRGQDNKVRNVIEGRVEALGGSAIFAGDCSWWERSSGGKRRFNTMSFVTVESSVSLPTVEIRPDSVLLKLFESFVGKDIEIPGDAQFNKTYRVTSPDEAACRAVITPRVTPLFQATKTSLHVRIADNVILISTGRFPWSVKGFGSTIDWMRVFTELLDKEQTNGRSAA
ncbi:MAG: hypothetical protein AAGB51_06445 [Planctomycetota bacterium]